MKTPLEQAARATETIEGHTSFIASLFEATEQICDAIEDLSVGTENIQQVAALTAALVAVAETGKSRMSKAAVECASIRKCCALAAEKGGAP
jgi:hypothetical protein